MDAKEMVQRRKHHDLVVCWEGDPGRGGAIKAEKEELAGTENLVGKKVSKMKLQDD